jgi:S-DNA-T family DNA segregation ATPase FtsK/SpoIIIE
MNKDTTTSQAVSEEDTQTLDIHKQLKVFGILLMVFALLLFLALVSHTPRDGVNTTWTFSEFFGAFSDDPQIRIKVDTTFNIVGLVGAFLSDLLLNYTIGYFIIGLPIFLFLWGWKLYRFGEIPSSIVTITGKYLLFAIVCSCVVGSIACFSSMQSLPLEWYGNIGAFLGSVVSNIISPIGGIIVFVALLVFMVIKLTDIHTSNLKRTFGNAMSKVRHLDFIARINSMVPQRKDDDIYKVPHQPKTVMPDDNMADIAEVSISSDSVNDYEENVDETINNAGNVVDNVFNQADTATQPVVLGKSASNLHSAAIDYSDMSDFKSKIKLKIIDEPQIENKDNVAQDNVSSGLDVDDDNSVVIDDAIFTYQPPADIELPKQAILSKDYADSNEPQIRSNPPIEIPPLKIDVNPSYNTNAKSIEEPNPSIVERIADKFRNPLSVGVLDEKIRYIPPSVDLLENGNEVYADEAELQRNAQILQEKLATFKIDISGLEVTRGPVVTQYEFIPADGVKISSIEGLSNDLAMALKAKSVHIIAPVPGKGTVGIQIPNANPSMVRFRSVVNSVQFQNSRADLPLALGKTINGEPYIADLAKMPHLLIGGATGSGKSVGINTIISSLLYKKHPRDLKFIIIDPKKVELSQYAMLSNHFLAMSPDLDSEIITEPQDAITILKAAVVEMEKRYDLLKIAGQRNLKDYNDKVRSGELIDANIDHRPLPYIVAIIDELADLMLTAGKEIETPIVRLAQMARAVGIHLIIATQRPSVKVITGLIKANFPARIAYLVAQKMDSRIILDEAGADSLLGNGDMLYKSPNAIKAMRIQNPFISTDEVEHLCASIHKQQGYSTPYMLPSLTEVSSSDNDFDTSDLDPLFMDAAELVIDQQQGSTSMLQRRLGVGFARAGRIMDQLQQMGVVGPQQGSKPRAVLLESIADVRV